MQTIGFTDSDTAALSVFFSLGYAVGMVTGGVLGDAFAKHFSRYGRPSVNQFSIAVTAPLVAVYFKGLPGLPSRLSSTLTLAGRTTHSEAVAAAPKCLLIIPLQSHPAGVHAAGAAQFSSGVPDHMHSYMALYSVVLFLVAIAAPMEQSNNAAMYAEVSQSDFTPGCHVQPQQLWNIS